AVVSPHPRLDAWAGGRRESPGRRVVLAPGTMAHLDDRMAGDVPHLRGSVLPYGGASQSPPAATAAAAAHRHRTRRDSCTADPSPVGVPKCCTPHISQWECSSSCRTNLMAPGCAPASGLGPGAGAVVCHPGDTSD